MELKNNSNSTKVFGGLEMASGAIVSIDSVWKSLLSKDSSIGQALAIGDAVVIDYGVELSFQSALDFIFGYLIKAEVTKQPEPMPFAQPLYRTKRDKTSAIETVEADSIKELDFILTQERYATGGSLVYQGAVFGDYITAQVVDKLGVIPEAYRSALCEAWPVVAEYIVGQWIPVTNESGSGQMAMDTYPLNAKISAGLCLRIKYHAVASGGPRKVGVNYHLTKKL